MNTNLTLLDYLLRAHVIDLGRPSTTQISQLSLPLSANAAYQVNGASTDHLDARLPRIVLLAPESTPENIIVAQGAEDKFRAAAQNLETNGVEFYTVLRPRSRTIFHWTREVLSSAEATTKA